ncbi:MAG: ATP-binding protein [Ferruginibacter sp.]
MKKHTGQVTKAAVIIILLIAVMVLAGWIFNNQQLKSVLPNVVSMKFNTAICFILSAILLYVSNRADANSSKRRISIFCCIIIFIVASLNLAENLTGWNSGIDEVLWKDNDNTFSIFPPGRMSLSTSVNFILIALSFAGIDKKKHHLFVQSACIFMFLFSFLVLLYHFFGSSFLDSFPQLIRTAILTAIVFVVLTTGIFCSNPLCYLKFSFHKKIAGFFILTIMVLAFTFFAINRSNKFSIDSEQWVIHTNEVLALNQQILNNSNDIQIALLNFILSGRETFHKNYHDDIAGIHQLVHQLKFLTRDNPGQQTRINSLDKLVGSNNDEEKQLIQLNKDYGIDAANKLYEQRIIAMKDLHVALKDIEKEESKLLVQRKAKNEQSMINSSHIITVFQSLIVLLFLTAFFVVYFNTRSRNKAELEIMKLNKSLEVEVQENKQLHLKLEQRALQLEESNMELERFASIASHDLQEPLRTITSFLNLVEKNLGNDLSPTNKRYIDFATDGADRMKNMVQDMFKYSRVNSDSYVMEDVDCNKVLTTITKLFELRITEANANMLINPLPVIQGIQPQIQQLLQNLVGNALKYHNSKSPEIEVGCVGKDALWEFYVKDNGIGIEQKSFKKIFMLFQRLHTRKEFSGTGIGLAICKKIVEKHGGEIWVKSEPGTGSTFYFNIPRIVHPPLAC